MSLPVWTSQSLQRLVVAAGEKSVAVGRERHRPHIVGMPGQRPDGFAGRDGPQPDRAVVAARGRGAAVRRDTRPSGPRRCGRCRCGSRAPIRRRRGVGGALGCCLGCGWTGTSAFGSTGFGGSSAEPPISAPGRNRDGPAPRAEQDGAQADADHRHRDAADHHQTACDWTSAAAWRRGLPARAPVRAKVVGLADRGRAASARNSGGVRARRDRRRIVAGRQQQPRRDRLHHPDHLLDRVLALPGRRRPNASRQAARAGPASERRPRCGTG